MRKQRSHDHAVTHIRLDSYQNSINITFIYVVLSNSDGSDFFAALYVYNFFLPKNKKKTYIQNEWNIHCKNNYLFLIRSTFTTRRRVLLVARRMTSQCQGQEMATLMLCEGADCSVRVKCCVRELTAVCGGVFKTKMSSMPGELMMKCI